MASGKKDVLPLCQAKSNKSRREAENKHGSSDGGIKSRERGGTPTSNSRGWVVVFCRAFYLVAIFEGFSEHCLYSISWYMYECVCATQPCSLTPIPPSILHGNIVVGFA